MKQTFLWEWLTLQRDCLRSAFQRENLFKPSYYILSDYQRARLKMERNAEVYKHSHMCRLRGHSLRIWLASAAPASWLDMGNLSSVSTSLWFPGFGLSNCSLCQFPLAGKTPFGTTVVIPSTSALPTSSCFIYFYLNWWSRN